MKTPTNTYQKVYDFALDYANTKFRPFTSEDIKVAIENKFGKSKFSDYGGVMRSLKLKGAILEHGHTKATLPKANARLITLWISKAYSVQQSENRSRKFDNQYEMVELFED